MITVIICGGSGSRLWPISTRTNPKQLLRLTNRHSLLQNSYERAKAVSDCVFLMPEASHADAVKSQIPELSDQRVLVEPSRRGTANCVIAALAHISRNCDIDEPIAFVHADHHIRDVDGFARTLLNAGRISTQTAEIVLIGVEPTYAATGFGYIEKEKSTEGMEGAHRVLSFKEKPDPVTAQKYVRNRNFLWNSGYMVGSLRTFLIQLSRHAPRLLSSFEALENLETLNGTSYDELYNSFPNEVIDKALLEKSDSLLVVPANFDWSDVGTYRDLYNSGSKDSEGNRVIGQAIRHLDVTGSYVMNEEAKPLVVIGLDDVVVVNTPEGILVATKEMASKVGELSSELPY